MYYAIFIPLSYNVIYTSYYLVPLPVTAGAVHVV